MSDFETRLREALVDGVGDAPAGTGLADAARSRARRRRRTTLAGAAAAVVLAAVAVPVGLGALGGHDTSAPVVVDPSRPADAGWRTETWHQATIRVPDDWGYGALGDRCVGSPPAPPVVERPGGDHPYVGCPNMSSYGVSFSPAGKDAYDAPRQPEDGSVPEGAWVGEQTVAGVRVSVVTSTKDLAQRILDSMQVVGDVDPNGCSEVSDVATYGAADGVSVCRYDDQHQLVQSEVLSGADADAARAAIAAAPPASSVSPCPGTPEEPGPVGGGEFVVLNDGTEVTTVDFAGPCRERGIFTTDAIHELTADVLYWALSPGWSRAVDGDVPLPEQLRTR